jgi:hypothetical protein
MTDTKSEVEVVLNTTNSSSSNISANEDSPKRITTSIQNIEMADIARKQLQNLTKRPLKAIKKTSPSSSDAETKVQNPIPTANNQPQEQQQPENEAVVTEILYEGKPTMSNLSSAIISKQEIDNEIRKKIAKMDNNFSVSGFTEIEIPQEIILSELTETIQKSPITESQEQLNNQELIDILEGKPDDETEIYEVIGENGMLIVKDQKNPDGETTSYEIVTQEEEELEMKKQKILEREIAMRQIASMPTRKNKKTVKSTEKVSPAAQTLAQSLALDWDDKEEVTIELSNMENMEDHDDDEEPKIKILNMTILNEQVVEVPKTVPSPNKMELPTMPKILNKNAPKVTSPAPKILNINAPKADDESTRVKQSRVIKKKTIWDPSQSNASTEKKTSQESIILPSTITIKKLTKESINKAKELNSSTSLPAPVAARKTKKKSEIDKLFQDEGAINMIQSLELQNKINAAATNHVDVNEPKLSARAKTIRQNTIKQSTSPPEIKTAPVRPQRIKREVTPIKTEVVKLTEIKKTSPKEKTEKAVIITKIQKQPNAGRKRKVDDESWDYVQKAQTTCEDAMIIRRHSSSSYSSSNSPRRLSLDQSISDLDNIKPQKDESNKFEFTKPQQKMSPDAEENLKNCVGGLVEELRNTLSHKLAKNKTNVNEKKNELTPKGRKRTSASLTNNNNNCQELPIKRERRSRSQGNEKDFQIKKLDNVSHIILNRTALSCDLLMEIKSALLQLENDKTCDVVLITGLAEELDYSPLVQTTVDKRKQAASDLATAVK